ncbi:MAG: ABC transporter permease [Bacteroidota bacterium]
MSPPQQAIRLFQWYCNPVLQEQILGDLEEQFEEDVHVFGRATAKRKFWWNVIRFMRRGIFRDMSGTQKLNHYGMFKNHLKIGFRAIQRNTTFSLLNIAGLSVGIAACVLILVYVQHELSYDTYNEKYDRIYRVVHHYGEEDGGKDHSELQASDFQVWGNAPVAPALHDYFPQIEKVFRFTSGSPWLIKYKDITFSEEDIPYADSTAFEVFDWEMLAGNPKTALVRPNTIVLTEKLAKKYFGKENPIGKTIIMDSEDPFAVTGVVKIPPNSHFDFNGLVSMSTFRNRRAGIFDSWGYVDFYTYFTLDEGADINKLSAKINDFMDKKYTGSDNYTIAFEHLSEAYLHSEAGRQPGATGSLQNVYIFTTVALFILLIACINFMNLSTARSVERAKEVGIRKTIGSQKQTLIYQFLIEAIVLACLSGLLAIILVVVGYPVLEELAGKSLQISSLFSVKNLLLCFFGILIIGVIAGVYPAFVLASFAPLKVLKGSFKSSSSGVWLRKGLVVVQFSLSILLLAGAMLVSFQLNYLRSFDKGFKSDQVVVVDFGYDYLVQNKRNVLKKVFSDHPSVEAVSVSRAAPGDFFPNAGTAISGPATGEMIVKGPAIYEVDEAFVPTYQMELAAGRNFSSDFPLDSSNALLVNESAARLYGYSNPEDIVGKSFSQWGRTGKVVGVIRDFNYVSLHNAVEPLSLRYGTRYNVSVFSLRLNTDDYARTLSELEDIWNDIVPHYPFNARFVNQAFEDQYDKDRRFGSIFSVFSGLAVFVACLGLFGLTIYSTAQRQKEIGVRKVLGASVVSLVRLLSKEFVLLFVVALAIAIPFSWWVMSSWLHGFAYRINIGWEVYGIAASGTLAISLLTMSFKTFAAARSNPVVSLRDE